MRDTAQHSTAQHRDTALGATIPEPHLQQLAPLACVGQRRQRAAARELSWCQVTGVDRRFLRCQHSTEVPHGRRFGRRHDHGRGDATKAFRFRVLLPKRGEEDAPSGRHVPQQLRLGRRLQCGTPSQSIISQSIIIDTTDVGHIDSNCSGGDGGVGSEELGPSHSGHHMTAAAKSHQTAMCPEVQ